MRLLSLAPLPLLAVALLVPSPTSQAPAPPPASSSASSQQSSSPGYVFNATTRNVILDAVVADNKGNVITGLTRNDFRVREDGAPQQILFFDAIAAGTGSAEARPHTILLVEGHVARSLTAHSDSDNALRAWRYLPATSISGSGVTRHSAPRRACHVDPSA